jgi:hypothetical protein
MRSCRQPMYSGSSSSCWLLVPGRAVAVEVGGAAEQVAAGSGGEPLPDVAGRGGQQLRCGGGRRERVAGDDHEGGAHGKAGRADEGDQPGGGGADGEQGEG